MRNRRVATLVVSALVVVLVAACIASQSERHTGRWMTSWCQWLPLLDAMS